MSGGTTHSLSGSRGSIALVGTGHGVCDVNHGSGEAEDSKVDAIEFYTGFATNRLVVAVFVVAGGFVDEENTGGFGAGGGDGGTGVRA